MRQRPASLPRLSPLTSVEQLFQWRPDADQLPCRASVLLTQEHLREKLIKRPRLLVCHDLRGGYNGDNLLQGSNDWQAFRLHHWHLVDTFVYFSHHLVSIPPPSWTDAAHRHGVSVIGTLITEWGPGEKCCRNMFVDRTVAEFAAVQLAQIASYYKFEGWLINIENKVSPDNVPHLLHFLRTLRHTLAENVPGGCVIWYDAVTTSGQLLWQNCLNDENESFLKAAGSIFVNYHWNATTPLQVARRAGRVCILDVYMGVDVFGRGTYGGGGFQSGKALALVFEAGLSGALFAPGWVHEIGSPAGWVSRSQRLWLQIAQAYGEPRPTAYRLPFATHFGQGAGLGHHDQRPMFAGELGSQGIARHEACGAYWRRDVFSVTAQQLAAHSIGWLSLVIRSGTLTGSFTAYCGWPCLSPAHIIAHHASCPDLCQSSVVQDLALCTGSLEILPEDFVVPGLDKCNVEISNLAWSLGSSGTCEPDDSEFLCSLECKLGWKPPPFAAYCNVWLLQKVSENPLWLGTSSSGSFCVAIECIKVAPVQIIVQAVSELGQLQPMSKAAKVMLHPPSLEHQELAISR